MTLTDALVTVMADRARLVGLSQRALADAAGMPATTVHRIMRGQRAVTVDELGALGRALGETPAALLAVAATRTSSG